ncbi:MAG: DUF4267 domain-containing protein [Burkholderiaceae bacterium]|nr:DUF4267 domain-containing protein [Burkholderiaceae bacterium]
MNTNMNAGSSALKMNSLLFWCALLTPLAIIPLGINFLLNPVGASTAFGIGIHDPAAFPFMWTKGIRDIFSGLVMLPFFFKGDRRTIAIMLAVAVLIPIGDGLIVLQRVGVGSALFMHWGTALYMAIVAAILFGRKKA